MNNMPPELTVDPETAAFYRNVLQILAEERLPVLVGGAYAFAVYTGIQRQTKDLDLFIQRADYERLREITAGAGYETELTFPHWLGKVHSGALFVDIIFNSGNGLTPVKPEWFDHAVDAEVLGVPTKLMPIEEMIASKAFIMERERFDGADIAHLLRLHADTIDWRRLLHLVGPHWRVLLSHLVLFGFVYPAERGRLPAWVMDELLGRMAQEGRTAPATDRVCRGTLLSREQYLYDVDCEGYADARLPPLGTIEPEHLDVWTDAIFQDKS